MNSSKRLCVGIPVVGQVSGVVYFSHLATMVPLTKCFQLVIPQCLDVFPHDRARERIITEALRLECDYLYFIDSDMLVPPGAALRLYQVMQDTGAVMTTAHAYRRGYPYTGVWTIKSEEAAYMTNIEAAPDSRPMEIHSAGLACNLIDLNWVRENLKPPYFFQGKWMQPDGSIESVWEDAFFCQSIRQFGGKIIGVPDVRVGHYDTSVGVIDDETVVWLRQRVIQQTAVEDEKILPSA